MVDAVALGVTESELDRDALAVVDGDEPTDSDAVGDELCVELCESVALGVMVPEIVETVPI